jgi:hypothetical protein
VVNPTKTGKFSLFLFFSLPIKNHRAISPITKKTKITMESNQITVENILLQSYQARIAVARNPCTPTDVLTDLAKDDDGDVRCSVAYNPCTPADALTALAKDEYSFVRRNVAGNPVNQPVIDITPSDRHITVKEKFVSIQGTNHIWYKYNHSTPFYVCGCFIGNRAQLLMNIYNGNSELIELRLSIFAALDNKFNEVFNK